MSVMNRAAILELIHAHKAELDRLGVRSLGLFGSAARDELGTDSDIDFLAELSPPYTFDRYIQVKFFLEDLLGRPVDLVMPETLKPRLRSYIEKDVLYVA